MPMKHLTLMITTCAALASASAALTQTPNGEQAYKENCASCHDAGADRAPSRDAFRAMTPEAVLAAMETGPMLTMASRSSTPERRAIAEFVTGKSFAQPLDPKPSLKAMCALAPSTFNPSVGPTWNGWGVDAGNTRFQGRAT